MSCATSASQRTSPGPASSFRRRRPAAPSPPTRPPSTTRRTTPELSCRGSPLQQKLTLDLRFRRTYVCRVSSLPLSALLPALQDLPQGIATRLTTAAGLSRGRLAPEFLPTRN